MNKPLFLLLPLVPLLLMLPINVSVNAQLPFLPKSHTQSIVNQIQITNSTRPTNTNTTTIMFYTTNKTEQALGKQLLKNSTAIINLSNHLHINSQTVDDLKNHAIICAYIRQNTTQPFNDTTNYISPQIEQDLASIDIYTGCDMANLIKLNLVTNGASIQNHYGQTLP